jgi:threonyl-tRNA synthetase
MKTINITLPDNTVKIVEAGTSGGDIAKSIGEGLYRASVAVKANGNTLDLHAPLNEDTSLEIITNKTEGAHHILMHSAAHLLAQAVKEIFPSAKIAIGPALEDRFYYDIDVDQTINEEILVTLEKKMKEISKRNLPVQRKIFSRKEALHLFEKMNEDYKIEIISELDELEKISTYEQGGFIDLCRGPHIPSTGKIKYFKLLSSAGAYWRGDENNKMLQRIYGTAWFSKEELNDFLHMLEEAKKRDHRKLGKELGLFAFDDEIGPGLPLWLPNGSILVDELEALAKETENAADYMRVRTPHLTKGILYERSGHLDHYKDSMYPSMDVDGTDYYVKPMNCPHHHKIFAATPKSYRDLPYRLAEYGTCYRYEKSGQLFGLMRVRSMQMNDAHIYCTKKQFKEEFLNVCRMYIYYFEIFGIDKYQMRLSLHDPDDLGGKYVDEPALWLETEEAVREALNEGGINYIEIPGEAAFYGPKIDVQVWSAIGREFTLATNQVDFVVPGKFNLKYVGEDGTEKTPLCIHRAPLSTHERFIGFLIEHFGGDFPLWLAPQQVVILPVSDKYLDYALQVKDYLKENGVRVKVDQRGEKIGAKIRDAELTKIPIMLIVGEKEVSEGQVSVRRRHAGDIGIQSYKSFLEEVKIEIKERRRGKSYSKN